MKFPLLHNSRGITLVELVVVIAIVGVLVGVAGPNFSALIAERSVAAETRRLISALKLARSEARARGSVVTLSRDAGEDWSGSIDIYVDTTSDNNPLNGSDDLVQRSTAANRTVSAIDDQGASDQWISFNVKGWLAEAQPLLIAVCSPKLDESDGMYIAINRVGKIRERQIGTDSRGCNP